MSGVRKAHKDKIDFDGLLFTESGWTARGTVTMRCACGTKAKLRKGGRLTRFCNCHKKAAA